MIAGSLKSVPTRGSQPNEGTCGGTKGKHRGKEEALRNQEEALRSQSEAQRSRSEDKEKAKRNPLGLFAGAGSMSFDLKSQPDSTRRNLVRFDAKKVVLRFR